MSTQLLKKFMYIVKQFSWVKGTHENFLILKISQITVYDGNVYVYDEFMILCIS